MDTTQEIKEMMQRIAVAKIQLFKDVVREHNSNGNGFIDELKQLKLR